MSNKILKIFIILLASLTLVSCSNKKIMQYKLYGIDNLENENYVEALDYFDKAIMLGNGEVGKMQYDLLMYKAECLFMLKRYREAKEIYEILLKIDKNNKSYSELYNNVSSVVNLVEFKNAVNAGEIDYADELLLELKKLGFEHEKSVMFNQGVLYEKKGEWKNALNTFNYFLKQYPNDEAAEHEVEFITAQNMHVNY